MNPSSWFRKHKEEKRKRRNVRIEVSKNRPSDEGEGLLIFADAFTHTLTQFDTLPRLGHLFFSFLTLKHSCRLFHDKYVLIAVGFNVNSLSPPPPYSASEEFKYVT